ncbi:MAG TPA: hypothetical protein VFQ16_04055 [Burkholderiaceae bacterium]|nr:hypothetical protein [Burkholderiaceae bacterium]
MIGAGSLEYAHARLAARWGRRADEALWRRVETTRDLSAVLDLVRASALAPWVEGLTPGAGVHAIEAALGRRWRSHVDEVAAWMPPAWHAAVTWCAVLAELPLALHLARGGTPPAGRPRDDAAASRPAAAAQRRALVDAAAGGPAALWAAWCAHWQRVRPAATADPHEPALLALLRRHGADFAAPGADGWALRRALQQRLVALRRRAIAEPSMAFIELVLAALEGERLRGELVRRAAFPQRAVAA